MAIAPSAATRGRVEQQLRCDVGIDRAAQHQRVLVGSTVTLEHEQLVATHLAAEHRRQGDERGKALVPPSPIGTGIERLSCVLVLGGNPLGDLGRIARFQPPVGVGQLDAVNGVDHVLAPGGRRR